MVFWSCGLLWTITNLIYRGVQFVRGLVWLCGGLQRLLQRSNIWNEGRWDILIPSWSNACWLMIGLPAWGMGLEINKGYTHIWFRWPISCTLVAILVNLNHSAWYSVNKLSINNTFSDQITKKRLYASFSVSAFFSGEPRAWWSDLPYYQFVQAHSSQCIMICSWFFII